MNSLNPAQRAAIAQARGVTSMDGLSEEQRRAIEQAQQRAQNTFTDQFGNEFVRPVRAAPEAESPGFIRRTGDVAAGFLSGIPRAAGAVVSVGSLVPGVNRFADQSARGLGRIADGMDERLLSDFQQDQNTALGQAVFDAVSDMTPPPEDASTPEKVRYVMSHLAKQGGAAAGFLKDNPTQVINLVAESLPYLIAGGAIGGGIRAASAGRVGLGTAAATGEGLVGAGIVTGEIVEGLREQGIEDYTADRLYGIPAGVATAAIGRLGARVGGGTDADVIATSLLRGEPTDLLEGAGRGGLLSSVARGAAVEGAEEFFQESAQTAFGNLGQREPWYEDVGSSAVIGAATGAATGGALNLAGLGQPSNSETNLGTPEAQLFAQEELQLQAAALAEERAAIEQQVAQERAVKEARDRHAPTFMSFDQFRKEQQEQQRAALTQPDTELGQAFREWRLDNDIYMTTPAETKKAQNDFLKTLQNNTEAQREAYFAAFDQHAAQMEMQASTGLAGEPTTTVSTQPDAAAQPDTTAQQDTTDGETVGDMGATTSETTSTAETTQTGRRTKRDDARDYAEQVLGENWEADNAELSQMIADGKSIYAKRKDGKSRFERMVDSIAADVAAAQAPETGTPGTGLAANTQAPATPTDFRPRNERDRTAVAYAQRELGENWQSTYPQLVQTLQDSKYGLFQRDVDALAQTQEADLQRTAGAGTAAQIVANSDQLADTLSGNQKSVFDALLEAFQNNEGDTLVQEDGSFNFTALAERAGVNSRQAAQSALKQLRPKIAETLGVEPDQIVQALQASSRGETEAATDTDAPVSVLDPSELGGAEGSVQGMGTVASAGGTQAATAEGITAEDRAFTAQRSDEVDPVYEQRVAEAKARLDQQIDQVLSEVDASYAINLWDNLKSDGAVNATDLSRQDTYEWLMAVLEFQGDYISRDQLDADQRDIERRYDAQPQEALADGTDSQSDQSPAVEGPQRSEETGAPPEGSQAGGSAADTGAGADTGVIGASSSTPVVTTKKRRKIDMSKARAARAKMGVTYDPMDYSSPESMANVVQDLTGQREHPRIHVFETEADAIAAIERGDVPATDIERIRQAQPYGFVTVDERGQPHAHFITSRIPAGMENAAFMHEVGSHMGLDQILTQDQIDTLAGRIGRWADKDDGSLESKLARDALGAVTDARIKGAVADADFANEVIAYFVEAATIAGVEPTVTSPVGRMLRTLYAAFKNAMRKLRLANIDTITPQNIVDMAYGAARIELSTRKHGTGADFRAFNHKYMGSGEGNQAYGFGTYLADRFGIARNYLRAMERKAENTTTQNKDAILTLNEMPAVAEKLNTGGIRLANSSGDIYTSPIFRGGEIVGQRPITFDRDATILTAEGAQLEVGMLGLEITAPDKFGIKRQPLERLMHPTENRPLFSRDELNEIQDAINAKIWPDGVPEGTLLHVDTTVADSELVNWFDDLRSDSGQRLLDVIQTIDADAAGSIAGDITSYVRAKQGLDDETFVRVPEEIWDDMVMDTTIGEVHKILENSRHAERFMDLISPEAYARIKDYPSVFVRNKAAVAEFLDQNGIKGIIYTDGSSRGDSIDSAMLNRAMFNRVIFNDQNLVVVGRTPGSRVSNSTDTVSEIKFGTTRDWADKTFGGAQTAQFLGNARAVFQNPLNSTKYLHQFINESAEAMPSIKKWYNSMLESEKTRNSMLQPAEAIAAEAMQLAPDRMAVVNDFIGKSTFYQKWGYDPQWEGKKVTIDPTMEAAFNRLKPEEQKIAKDIFQHGENMRQRVMEAAKKLGVSNLFTFTSKLDGPYAPLKRFGNYAGELKSARLIAAEEQLEKEPSAANRKRVETLKQDASHYVISFFDTLGAAEKFAAENRGKYAKAEASERSIDAFESPQGNPQAFEKVIAALRADSKSGLDNATRSAVENLVKQLYYESLDESNARLAGARRLNRAGYDKNMLRSFLVNARSQSYLLAQMEHGADINTALVEAKNEAAKDRANLQPIYNTIARKYSTVLTPRTGMLDSIQDSVLAFNTVYMLTSSVGYHAQNATQPTIAVAKIAGDFGQYGKAWGSLFRGYKIAQNVIDGSFTRQVATVVTSGFVDLNNAVKMDVSKAPKQYQKLLEDLQLRQLLDVGIEYDLNIENKFDTGYETLNKMSDGMHNLTHRLYQVARYVEAQNRVSTAIAAFDMARANPKMRKAMDMTAEEYAISVVESTQGNYSRLNAPVLFDALPRATTQFRKFQVMMAWLYANAAKQAFKGESAEMRAAGRRTLGFLLAHTALLAGAKGIPFATAVVPLFLMMGSEGDEPQDLERWVRDNVEDERLATLISRGVPAFFGLDMQAKLTQSDIFLPFNPDYLSLSADEQSAQELAFRMFFGPTGSQITNFGRAASFFSEGDTIRGTEMMLPRGLRSQLESYRFATEGYTRRNGDIMIDPRDIDIRSLMMNALNLPSTEINKIKWTAGQQFELQQWFSNESGRMRRQYVQASQRGDNARVNALRQEWRELQDAKDRVRPFFNDAPGVLNRQPTTDLIRSPRQQQRRELRYQRQLGTD